MKIGLTYTGSEKKHLNYVNWLKGKDSIEIIELSAAKNNLNELQNCDALVMSGGVDVHPSFYNNTELNYPGAENFEMDRDQFEKDAFNLSQKNQIPVLGICRGMQLINCLLGGTLIQDLGALNPTHKGSPDKRHFVEMSSGTQLHHIAKTNRSEVNSSHHQAIDKLGNGLKVNCKADDGTIEGVERSESNKPFLLAVQWHPERMEDQSSPLSKNVRDSFIDAARSRQTAG